MKTEAQSSISTAQSPKIITPNKNLVGVKKSEPKKEKEAESQENQEVKEHLRLQLLEEVKKRVKANE